MGSLRGVEHLELFRLFIFIIYGQIIVKHKSYKIMPILYFLDSGDWFRSVGLYICNRRANSRS